MTYQPPFMRNDRIDSLCMEIAELVGMLAPDERDVIKARALEFFKANPTGNINQLIGQLGCSKRTAERLVAELKNDGALLREGSTRAGEWIVVE